MLKMTWKLVVVLSIVGFAAVCPVFAQGSVSPSAGRYSVHVPDPTDDGKWDGTWFHVSRDHRVALWMRTSDGRPEMKLQYFRIGKPEQFETDWSCRAEYEVDGAPAVFTLTVTESDANRVEGKWDWDLDFADSSRYEDANLSVYRTGDGRQLVFVFDDFSRKLRRGQHVEGATTMKTWTFRKASKRHVRWDELPF